MEDVDGGDGGVGGADDDQIAIVQVLARARREFPRRVFGLLSGSVLLAIATEFCFIHYVGFYDFANELGHYFRFVSVVLAYLALIGQGGGLNARIAWAYVILRVLHSLVQVTVNRVMVRFLLFALSSLALIALTVHLLIAVFHG